MLLPDLFDHDRVLYDFSVWSG